MLFVMQCGIVAPFSCCCENQLRACGLSASIRHVYRHLSVSKKHVTCSYAYCKSVIKGPPPKFSIPTGLVLLIVKCLAIKSEA